MLQGDGSAASEDEKVPSKSLRGAEDAKELYTHLCDGNNCFFFFFNVTLHWQPAWTFAVENKGSHDHISLGKRLLLWKRSISFDPLLNHCFEFRIYSLIHNSSVFTLAKTQG